MDVAQNKLWWFASFLIGPIACRSDAVIAPSLMMDASAAQADASILDEGRLHEGVDGSSRGLTVAGHTLFVRATGCTMETPSAFNVSPLIVELSDEAQLCALRQFNEITANSIRLIIKLSEYYNGRVIKPTVGTFTVGDVPASGYAKRVEATFVLVDDMCNSIPLPLAMAVSGDFDVSALTLYRAPDGDCALAGAFNLKFGSQDQISVGTLRAGPCQYIGKESSSTYICR